MTDKSYGLQTKHFLIKNYKLQVTWQEIKLQQTTVKLAKKQTISPETDFFFNP